jgi:transposase-like protein
MQAFQLIEIVSQIFKRNKVSLEIKIIAIALFLQGLGIRRISKIVDKAKSSVHEWTLKFRENLNIEVKRKKRRCIAIDETKIKVNKMWYYVYAAIDVDTRELICMKVYTSRNYLTTLDFVKQVLRFCVNRDVEIITDRMPCYEQVCKRLGMRWTHMTFGKRNYVEHVFRSFKFFTMKFNDCLCVNIRKVSLILDKNYWFKRVLYLLGLWCKYMLFYWNFVRR